SSAESGGTKTESGVVTICRRSLAGACGCHRAAGLPVNGELAVLGVTGVVELAPPHPPSNSAKATSLNRLMTSPREALPAWSEEQRLRTTFGWSRHGPPLCHVQTAGPKAN